MRSWKCQNPFKHLKITILPVALLNNNYLSKTDIEDISDDCVVEFLEEIGFDNFSDLSLKIENTQINKLKWEDNQQDNNFCLLRLDGFYEQ